MKVPRQADIAAGNWGVIGDKAGKATFLEICSEKGANLVNDAQSKGVLETSPADPKGIEIRGKVERAMLKLETSGDTVTLTVLEKAKTALK